MIARSSASSQWSLIVLCSGVLLFNACDAGPANVQPLWDESAGWTIGAEQVRIGADEALAGHSLFRVRTALRDPDGHIIVLNGGSNEVRVFDASGRQTRSFGGTGQGPREFSALVGIWLVGGDTLVTYDVGQGRLLAWPLPGGDPLPVPIDVSHRPTIHGRFLSGAYLIGQTRQPERREPGTQWIDSVSLTLVVRPDNTPMPIARLPYRTMYAAPTPGGGAGAIYTPVAYSGSASIATGPDGFYYGFGKDWIISKYNASGEVTDTITRQGANVEFSEAMLDALIEQRVAMVPPEQAAMMRTYVEAFPWPDRLSAYQTLQLDSSGCLWVQHTVPPGADTSIWSVFAANGRWLGEIAIPTKLRPTHIGDQALTVIETDTDGVENVVVYAIEKPARAANCMSA